MRGMDISLSRLVAHHLSSIAMLLLTAVVGLRVRGLLMRGRRTSAMCEATSSSLRPSARVFSRLALISSLR